MRFKQDSVVLLLVASLIAVSYGAYRTGRRDPSASTGIGRRSPGGRSIVVDQSALITAEQLVRLPTTPDERLFAEDALRLADQEMDLAFAQAVRQAASQNRPLSPEAKEIDAELQELCARSPPTKRRSKSSRRPRPRRVRRTRNH